MPTQQTRRALAPNREEEIEIDSNAPPHDWQDWQESRHRASKQTSPKPLAMALGWFSIGLGLAETLAPSALARLIGVRNDRPLLFRLLGLREITSGIGILTNHRPAGWLWSRVAGDIMDLSLLGLAFTAEGSARSRLVAATAAVAGVTALDVIEAQELTRDKNDRAVRVAAITINRPPDAVYRFWRQLENLPRFMSHLESVHVSGETQSHWVARAPIGGTVEWDAEITLDRPGEVIAWRSLPGADVEHSGSVHFERAPGDRGTEVKVAMVYNPPGGLVGIGFAKLSGEEPGEQIKGDLRRFKQVMEAGEVVQSDSSVHRGMYPAQPTPDQTQS